MASGLRVTGGIPVAEGGTGGRGKETAGGLIGAGDGDFAAETGGIDDVLAKVGVGPGVGRGGGDSIASRSSACCIALRTCEDMDDIPVPELSSDVNDTTESFDGRRGG